MRELRPGSVLLERSHYFERDGRDDQAFGIHAKHGAQVLSGELLNCSGIADISLSSAFWEEPKHFQVTGLIRLDLANELPFGRVCDASEAEGHRPSKVGNHSFEKRVHPYIAMPRKKQQPKLLVTQTAEEAEHSKHDIHIPEDYAEDLLKFSEEIDCDRFASTATVDNQGNEYEQRLQAALDSGEDFSLPAPAAGQRPATEPEQVDVQPSRSQGTGDDHYPALQGHGGIEQEEMRFDFAAEIRSAARADAQAQQCFVAADGMTKGEVKLTPSSRNLLRFGYITALVAADGMTKGEVPGREMVECFSLDRELSGMLNDYLGEFGEFYDLEKHLSPGIKLAGLTVGVYLQVQAAKGKLARSDDSVGGSDSS